MGTLNSYKYPEHDIEKCVEITETIHNRGITQPELLANQLGHKSAESGAFKNKLTSLRRYGLINGSGDISLTPLAEKIVAPKPSSNERENAIAEAVTNVDLLGQLYERLDYEPPDEDIWYDLVEITGAERAEAQEKSDDIQELYETGLSYVRAAQDSDKEDDTTEESATQVPTTSVEQGRTVPEGADATLITNDARIDIRSRATYVAAKALFEDIGRKYRQKSTGNDDSDREEKGLEDFID